MELQLQGREVKDLNAKNKEVGDQCTIRGRGEGLKVQRTKWGNTLQKIVNGGGWKMQMKLLQKLEYLDGTFES